MPSLSPYLSLYTGGATSIARRPRSCGHPLQERPKELPCFRRERTRYLEGGKRGRMEREEPNLSIEERGNRLTEQHALPSFCTRVTGAFKLRGTISSKKPRSELTRRAGMNAPEPPPFSFLRFLLPFLSRVKREQPLLIRSR